MVLDYLIIEITFIGSLEAAIYQLYEETEYNEEQIKAAALEEDW